MLTKYGKKISINGEKCGVANKILITSLESFRVKNKNIPIFNDGATCKLAILSGNDCKKGHFKLS